MMKLKICMILYPNKSSKIERKYPPHKKTKVKERRKYSMGQLEIVARVESVARIQKHLEQSLEYRWLRIDLEMDGINWLQFFLVDNKLWHYLEML